MRPLLCANEALAPPSGHLWPCTAQALHPGHRKRAGSSVKMPRMEGNKARVQKPERETLEEPAPLSPHSGSEGIEEGSGSRDDMQKDGAL